MKVLFLDIDGVLNSARFFGSDDVTEGFEYGQALWCAAQIDNAAVVRLNRILGATGAVVVLSSSWREQHPFNRLQRALEESGFRGYLLSVTPRLHRTPDGQRRLRGHEIQEWLRRYPIDVEAFVILDDAKEIGPLSEHWIRTSWEIGLTSEHVEQAIAMLRRGA